MKRNRDPLAVKNPLRPPCQAWINVHSLHKPERHRSREAGMKSGGKHTLNLHRVYSHATALHPFVQADDFGSGRQWNTGSARNIKTANAEKEDGKLRSKSGSLVKQNSARKRYPVKRSKRSVKIRQAHFRSSRYAGLKRCGQEPTEC